MRALRIALIAFMVASLAPLAMRAHALGPRVLLQIAPGVSPALARRIAEVLASTGEVVAADSQAQQGDIAVAVAYVFDAHSKVVLRLTYYDAVSAVALFSDDLALRAGALKKGADRDIVDKAQSALAMVAPNTGAPPPRAAFAPAPVPAPAPAPVRVPVPVPDAQPEPDDDTPAEQEVVADGAERPLAATLGVGIGLGMYSHSMPLAVGSARVPSSVFPSFDVAVGVDGIADGAVTPGLRLAYASSIGYTLSHTSPDAVVASSAARTHELRIDAAININFGHSRRDVSLPIFVGYAWSSLRTDAELAYVNRHTLSGPHLGLELRIPLADGDFVLRLGPDVRFVLQVNEQFQRAGFGASGFAVGGEAEILVRMSERFALRAMFRELHASVSSKRFSGSFSEGQRFITVGAAATY